MPMPFPRTVTLSDELRLQLESLERANSTPQALAFRARIVLRAAEPDHPYNRDIAREFGCSSNTVSLWRKRFLQQGLFGLQDAPRSGRPRSFSPRGAG
jgi:transposase